MASPVWKRSTAWVASGDGGEIRDVADARRFCGGCAREQPAVQVKGKPSLRVHWTGFLNPNETGDYVVGIKADGSAEVKLGSKRLVVMYGPDASMGRVHFEKGRRSRWMLSMDSRGHQARSATPHGRGKTTCPIRPWSPRRAG